MLSAISCRQKSKLNCKIYRWRRHSYKWMIVTRSPNIFFFTCVRFYLIIQLSSVVFPHIRWFVGKNIDELEFWLHMWISVPLCLFIIALIVIILISIILSLEVMAYFLCASFIITLPAHIKILTILTPVYLFIGNPGHWPIHFHLFMLTIQ